MKEMAGTSIAACLFAGAASALFVGAVGSAAAIRLRERSFLHHRAAPPPRPPWFPAFDQVERSNAEQVRDGAMREELRLLHSQAKLLQDRSFGYLTAASLTLLCAFIITVASVTIGSEQTWLHLYSSAFDVAALITAFVTFRQSGSVRSAWLRQRAITELVRQWLTVEYLLGPPEPAITARVEALLARFNKAISGDHSALSSDVENLGRERLLEIGETLRRTEISQSSLQNYYAWRPQRQVDWFGVSLNRVGSAHHRRSRIVAATFFGAIAIAGVKLVAVLTGQETITTLALCLLLILIGLSGASSSAYLGQNQRSLRHRYGQQLHAIENWVRSARADGVLAKLEGRSVDQEKVAASIVKFEALMLTELLDWIAISSDDAMELAPS